MSDVKRYVLVGVNAPNSYTSLCGKCQLVEINYSPNKHTAPHEYVNAADHSARIAELEGDLNVTRLQRDAKLCSECPRTNELSKLQAELARAREAYDLIHLGMLYTARDNASPIYAASIDRAIRWIEQRSALAPTAETGKAE
jgi:hypothetical protein